MVFTHANRIKGLSYHPVKKRERSRGKLYFLIPRPVKQENPANGCIFKFLEVFQLKLLSQCKIINSDLIII